MKAMIFAAGLGTRLFPLTEKKPKALIRINDKSMLEYQLEKLFKAGFNEIIVNTHHFSEQVISFLNNYNKQGLKVIISDESDKLLDTGGGLIKAYPFFQNEKSLLIHNVDIFSNIDLKAFLDAHKQENAIATLAIRNRKTSRYLLFNDEMELCGWENRFTGEQKIVRDAAKYHPFAFSGIHCIQPRLIEQTNFHDKCSIIDIYLELAKLHQIKGFIHNDDDWMDAGKPRQIRQLAQIL